MAARAFTLIEVVISVVILAMVLSGLIYGYVQINRASEWSSMSLIGQSYALGYVEQVRSAHWNSQMWPITNGPGTGDELFPANGLMSYSKTETNFTATSQSLVVTTIVTLTDISTNNIKLRQIRADCVWQFPSGGKRFTNTVVTQRGPD